jgi:hypothetical protein
MPNIVIDVAAEFTGKKAFQQADTATQKLTKTAKTLGKTLGVAFSSAAILGFAKSSIKAAVEAQAQQERLAKLLKVTVGATDLQIRSLNGQAAALEKVGVVSAGNITQTQSQLATFNLQLSTIEKLTPAILDYVTAEKGAAASADEFKSMTNGLAQALSGNFASLTKTGFVLDENTKSIIKNGTEAERVEEIVKVLNSTYKGFNESLRQTSAGQLAALANAAENAKTIIGEGLVDAFKLLSQDTSIEQLNAGLEKTALYIADITRGLGVFIQRLKDIPVAGKAFQIPLEGYIQAIPMIGSYINILAAMGEEMRTLDRQARRMFTGGSGAPSRDFVKEREAKALAAKLAAEKKLAAAKLAADKKAAAAKIKADKLAAANAKKLSKAQSIFDVDRIQIAAALKGKISEEEKTRLLLMQAILDEDADAAEILSKKLEEIQKQNAKIAADLLAIGQAKDPFATWAGSLSLALAALGKLGKGIADVPGLVPGVNFNPNQNADRNYDLKVAAVEAAAISTTIFAEDDTIDDILTKVENVAEAAFAAAEAAAASVAETQTTVDALAASATNGYGVAGTNFNPTQSRDRNYDSGYMTQAPITVNVTNTGSVIMQDEFVTAVSDAVTIGLGQGLKIKPPGSLPDFE